MAFKIVRSALSRYYASESDGYLTGGCLIEVCTVYFPMTTEMLVKLERDVAA